MALVFWRFFGSDFSRRQPGLTAGNLKKAFASAGWDVRNQNAPSIEFFAKRDDIGLLAVGISVSEPSREMLYDVVQSATEQGAQALILTDDDCAQRTLDIARMRGVLLRRWPDIDGLEAGIAAIESDRALELKAAKLASPPVAAIKAAMMPLTTRQVEAGFLARTENISWWFEDRGGDALLVSFGMNGLDPEQGAKSNAALGPDNDVSVVGFEMNSLNWFPPDDMATAVESITQVLQDRFLTRVLYGVGPGGFAALRYGAALAAAATVGISPQYSIDPAIIEDNRFQKYYKSAIHSGMSINREHTSGKALILYDPYDVNDTTQATSIANVLGGDLTIIRVPFSGYACPHLVSALGFIASLLDSVLNQDVDVIKRHIVSLRRSNSLRAYYIALHLSTRRPGLANAIFQTGVLANPAAPWGHVAYRLANNGLARDVLDWTCAQANQNLEDPEAQASVALVALKASEFDLAFSYIQRALTLSPPSERYIYIESLIVAARTG